MGRLPKKAIERWPKLKNQLFPAIDKINDPMVTDAHKKELKKQVKKLYDQFQSGLSKTLKKADTAKTDKDALKPLNDAIKTANSYQGKVKTAKTKWVVDDHGIGDKMDAALKDIKKACVGETVRIAKTVESAKDGG
jgi:hypothetical protein